MAQERVNLPDCGDGLKNFFHFYGFDACSGTKLGSAVIFRAMDIHAQRNLTEYFTSRSMQTTLA